VATINILFIGDIVGLTGLEITTKLLNSFKEQYKIDFVIANGENVTEGKSLSEQDANILFHAGINVFTGGNHLWDRYQIKAFLSKEKRLLRPMNYPKENPGNGFVICDIKNNTKVGVLSLQGRTFMNTIDCPFKTGEWAISKIKEETNIIIVDFHAEATAEKLAFAWNFDGKVSAVIGTHTHIQTADERILPAGTAFISDAGMTGAYDSVVGMKKELAIKRFINQTPYKYEPASDDGKLCAVALTVDTVTGKTKKIKRITYPEFITELE